MEDGGAPHHDGHEDGASHATRGSVALYCKKHSIGSAVKSMGAHDFTLETLHFSELHVDMPMAIATAKSLCGSLIPGYNEKAQLGLPNGWFFDFANNRLIITKPFTQLNVDETKAPGNLIDARFHIHAASHLELLLLTATLAVSGMQCLNFIYDENGVNIMSAFGIGLPMPKLENGHAHPFTQFFPLNFGGLPPLKTMLEAALKYLDAQHVAQLSSGGSPSPQLLSNCTGGVASEPGSATSLADACRVCLGDVGGGELLCCDDCEQWYHDGCLQNSGGAYDKFLLLAQEGYNGLSVLFLCRNCDAHGQDSVALLPPGVDRSSLTQIQRQEVIDGSYGEDARKLAFPGPVVPETPPSKPADQASQALATCPSGWTKSTLSEEPVGEAVLCGLSQFAKDPAPASAVALGTSPVSTVVDSPQSRGGGADNQGDGGGNDSGADGEGGGVTREGTRVYPEAFYTQPLTRYIRSLLCQAWSRYFGLAPNWLDSLVLSLAFKTNGGFGIQLMGEYVSSEDVFEALISFMRVHTHKSGASIEQAEDVVTKLRELVALLKASPFGEGQFRNPSFKPSEYPHLLPNAALDCALPSGDDSFAAKLKTISGVQAGSNLPYAEWIFSEVNLFEKRNALLESSRIYALASLGENIIPKLGVCDVDEPEAPPSQLDNAPVDAKIAFLLETRLESLGPSEGETALAFWIRAEMDSLIGFGAHERPELVRVWHAQHGADVTNAFSQLVMKVCDLAQMLVNYTRNGVLGLGPTPESALSPGDYTGLRLRLGTFAFLLHTVLPHLGTGAGNAALNRFMNSASGPIEFLMESGCLVVLVVGGIYGGQGSEMTSIKEYLKNRDLQVRIESQASPLVPSGNGLWAQHLIEDMKETHKHDKFLTLFGLGAARFALDLVLDPANASSEILTERKKSRQASHLCVLNHEGASFGNQSVSGRTVHPVREYYENGASFLPLFKDVPSWLVASRRKVPDFTYVDSQFASIFAAENTSLPPKPKERVAPRPAPSTNFQSAAKIARLSGAGSSSGAGPSCLIPPSTRSAPIRSLPFKPPGLKAKEPVLSCPPHRVRFITASGRVLSPPVNGIDLSLPNPLFRNEYRGVHYEDIYGVGDFFEDEGEAEVDSSAQTINFDFDILEFLKHHSGSEGSGSEGGSPNAD